MPASRVIGAALCGALSVAVLPATGALASSSTQVPAGVSAHQWARVQTLSKALRVVRMCEASGNYRINTGNGYYGAYQFSADTWHRLGQRGLPNKAAPAVQDVAAARLHDARHSWADWGACGRKAAAVHA